MSRGRSVPEEIPDGVRHHDAAAEPGWGSSTHSRRSIASAATQYHVRVTGVMLEAYETSDGRIGRLMQLDAAGFLSTPGLRIGLAFAAVCLAAKVRWRRYREPI